MQGLGAQYYDGDDAPRDSHHNGSMHSNGGLPLSPEEAVELQQRQGFHKTIADLEACCLKWEKETDEKEKKVEKQGWEDEAAIKMDMRAERMREEEQQAADKETQALKGQLEYHRNLLGAETEKYERAKEHERGIIEREKSNREKREQLPWGQRQTSRNVSHGKGRSNNRPQSHSKVSGFGSSNNRSLLGPPVRQMASAGTLSAKRGGGAKSGRQG